MSKNKNKPNAFSVFCKDWKNKEEKNNRFFTMAEAISNPECNKEWKDLPEDKKAYYKTLAKNTKFQVEPDKKTGLGESLNAIETAQKKKQQFKDNMKEYISLITRSANECDSIQKLKFYIVHTNYLFSRTLDNNEVEYYPVEICVARCSIENGVEAVHHVLVSEPILKGYKNDAITHSKETHQIPVEFVDGESSYPKIFKELCNFMEPGKKNQTLPPLYTIWSTDDIYYSVKSILGRLAAASNKYDEYIRLYALEELFASMYNAVLDQAGAITFDSITAFRELKKDPYAYKHGLECDFHKTVGAGDLYCSQSIVKRWFYVLCDFCCGPLNIEKIPGVHIPIEKREPLPVLPKLSSTLSTMNINDSTYSSTLNMSNVSHNYQTRSPGRSAQRDTRRKTEANVKPIEIIDHSKKLEKLPEVKPRPLRPPYSKSDLANDIHDTTDSKSLDYSENSFPAIGQRAGPKKRSPDKNGSSGYANALKS